MPQFEIHWLPVLVAAVAQFLLGAIWYSPILFGNAWMAAIGKTKEQIEKEFHPGKLVVAFIGSVVAAVVLAIFISVGGVNSLTYGALLGLLAGVGFALSKGIVNDVMESRPTALTAMELWPGWVRFRTSSSMPGTSSG